MPECAPRTRWVDRSAAAASGATDTHARGPRERTRAVQKAKATFFSLSRRKERGQKESSETVPQTKRKRTRHGLAALNHVREPVLPPRRRALHRARRPLGAGETKPVWRSRVVEEPGESQRAALLKSLGNGKSLGGTKGRGNPPRGRSWNVLQMTGVWRAFEGCGLGRGAALRRRRRGGGVSSRLPRRPPAVRHLPLILVVVVCASSPSPSPGGGAKTPPLY